MRVRVCGLMSVLVSAAFLPLCPALAGDVICFEAERADSVESPMRVVEVPSARPGTGTDAVAVGQDASGGKYLEVPQGAGNPPKLTDGSAVFAFDVAEAGTYALWCRVWWPDECGNSFTMSVDDGTSFTFGQDGTYRCWHWMRVPRRVKPFKLSKGRHTLKVMNREDGAMLDQVLWSRDRRYVPVGSEDVTVSPAPAAEPAVDEEP